MSLDFLTAVADGLTVAATKPNIYGYRPHKGQEQFHTSDRKGRILAGANRSGKSVAGFVEDVWWLTQTHPYLETPDPPVYGRVIVADRDNGVGQIGVPALQQWIPKKFLINGRWDKSYDKRAMVLRLANGSMLEFKTHGQDLLSFAGTPRHFLHVDEECPSGIFYESLLRLLDYDGKFWVTMTPVNGLTWVYDTYVQNEEKRKNEVELITLHINDNPHVSSEVAETISASGLTEEEKAIRVSGKFVPKGGLVLKHFNEQRHVMKTDHVPPPQWDWYVSIDHGLKNPTAILWHAISPEGIVVTFYEHYVSEWSISQHVTKIREVNAMLGKEPIMYIGDPSMHQRNAITMTSVHTEYLMHGIGIVNGSRDIQAGINKMNDYLRTNRWLITQRCPNLIQEARTYGWKTHVNSRTADRTNPYEEPQKRNDHAMDSSRYFFTYVPMLPPSAPVIKERPKLEQIRLLQSQGQLPWRMDERLVAEDYNKEYGWGEYE